MQEYKKSIVLSGAFGTWGSEFTKQLLAEGHEIFAVGRDEKAAAEYQRKFPDVYVLLTDFERVMLRPEIDVLIHAAAYKHIDLCQKNVTAAIHNNIIKTLELYKQTVTNDIKILYISTDKAVAPYSVYGKTKSLAEDLTWFYGGSVARSGNIAGSNGSVTHIWREAVKNKQPLKVTDMNMERYFIPIEEAVKVSWQGFKEGKKLILVDSGGKIKLGDIINKVLAEFGYTLETYKPGVEIIGLREGVERLSDDITWEFDKKYLEA